MFGCVWTSCFGLGWISVKDWGRGISAALSWEWLEACVWCHRNNINIQQSRTKPLAAGIPEAVAWAELPELRGRTVRPVGPGKSPGEATDAQDTHGRSKRSHLGWEATCFFWFIWMIDDRWIGGLRPSQTHAGHLGCRWQIARCEEQVKDR